MNKNNDDRIVTTSFQLSESLLVELKARAAQHDLSMAQAIRRAIVFWLELASVKENGVTYVVDQRSE